jgi:hypothetical protein
MDLVREFEELGITCPTCQGPLYFSPGKRISFFRCRRGCSYRLTFKQAWGVVMAEKRQLDFMRRMNDGEFPRD